MKPNPDTLITTQSISSTHVHLCVNWPKGVKGNAGAIWAAAQEMDRLHRLAREAAPETAEEIDLTVSVFGKTGAMISNRSMGTLLMADWRAKRDLARRRSAEWMVKSQRPELELVIRESVITAFEQAGVTADEFMVRAAVAKVRAKFNT